MTPFPLSWPGTWARTPNHRRKSSRFGAIPFGRIRDELFAELQRLPAHRVTLSTNIPLRNDGLPYANRTESDDPGAAVYFSWRGKPFVIACDSYMRTWENVRAVAKTIEAMRAIERHGATQLLERAVSGFSALPPGSGEAPGEPPRRPWWEVLGIPKMDGVGFGELADDPRHPMRMPMLKMAEAMFKVKVQEHHPDRGGSVEAMQELNIAIRQARTVLEKPQRAAQGS
jgi:hypothetical protein